MDRSMKNTLLLYNVFFNKFKTQFNKNIQFNSHVITKLVTKDVSQNVIDAYFDLLFELFLIFRCIMFFGQQHGLLTQFRNTRVLCLKRFYAKFRWKHTTHFYRPMASRQFNLKISFNWFVNFTHWAIFGWDKLLD